MTRRKSFKSHDPALDEPLEFDLNGVIWPCISGKPGAVLLDFVANTRIDDPSTGAKATLDLLREAIIPERREEWDAYIRDPANNVDLDVLTDVATWLAEEYTADRPTQPS